MTLSDLIWFLLLAALGIFIWQHLTITNLAKVAAKKHCKDLELQLLDQTVILKSLSLKRSPHSLLELKRKYIFEFSSVGDVRYKGSIVLHGKRVEVIETDAYKVI